VKVSGILLILLSANIEEIFIIMPNGNEYIEGKWVVLIIGLGLVIKSFMGCNFDILTMSKHYKQSVIVTACMSIATIGIYYAFTIAGGINGAAIAALITTITYSIITSVIIFKHYNIIPFNNKTLPLLIVLLLTYLLSTYLPSFENPYFSIILKSILIFTIYIIAVYYFKISSDINEHIRSVFAKFKAN
jgi:O-antigen/teichoic acid export membrane protein